MNRHIEDGVRLEQVCQLFRWSFVSFRLVVQAAVVACGWAEAHGPRMFRGQDAGACHRGKDSARCNVNQSQVHRCRRFLRGLLVEGSLGTRYMIWDVARQMRERPQYCQQNSIVVLGGAGWA